MKITSKEEELIRSELVDPFFWMNENYSTSIKLKAAEMILIGMFRLCCVLGEKKDLKKYVCDLSKKLTDEINY